MGVIRLYVPNRAHGDIIGPGGKTLKAISAKCGVTISVPRAHEQTSVIRISGEPAGLKAAQSEVEAVLGFAVGTDPLTKAFLAVPKAKHSRIVGKGAEILKSIENASSKSKLCRELSFDQIATFTFLEELTPPARLKWKDLVLESRRRFT